MSAAVRLAKRQALLLCASRIQSRAFSTSRYSAKGIFGLSKKKGSWEQPDAPIVPGRWKAQARKLKEALTTRDQDTVAQQALKLAEDAPDGKFPASYVPLLETALRGDSKELLARYGANGIQKIYRLLAVSEIERQQLVTRLYMALYSADDVPAQEAVRNGMLYAQTLRANGMATESRKLLAALLNTHRDALTDEVALAVLRSVMHPVSDSQSIQTVVEALGPSISLNVYHEAILLFVEAFKANEAHQLGTATPQEAFMELLNTILWGNKRLQPTTETIIITLDACLSLEAEQAAKRVMRTLVLPRLDHISMEDHEAMLQFYELLLLAVTRFGDDLATGERIVGSIMADFNPAEFAKETWDVLIQWTVYSNADVAAVRTVLESMRATARPNVETLNGALAVALKSAKRSDAYANALADLFGEFGVDRDVETFALLVDRAVASFEPDTGRQLFLSSVKSGADWTADDFKHIGAVHRLLVAMSTSPPVDPAAVFEVYQALSMFKTQLSYEAQVEILKMLLGRTNLDDVRRFLKEQFGENPALKPAAVPQVYHELFDAVLTAPDYVRAWELYGILNKTISLPYESYHPVMARFCELGRPDAALLIFRYMKARNASEGLPAPRRDEYVMLFGEFSKWMFEDGVKELADHFRLDVAMDLDPAVLSSMLSAYTQLEDGFATENTWRDLVASGSVSPADITTMIKHYTRTSLLEVESFWGSFPQRFGLEPTEENLRQYLIANCYHGYYLRAFEIARSMEEVYQLQPSQDTLEALYNWSMVQNRKDQIRAWALEAHPEKWAALESSGRLNSYVLPESSSDNPDHARMEAIDTMENESRLTKT